MIITMRQMCAELSASIISLTRTQGQLVAAKTERTTAKEQRDTTEQDHNAAHAAITAEHPDGNWPRPEVQRLMGLNADRVRAAEAFEAADRRYAKLCKLAADQQENHNALSDEYLGEKQRDLVFSGKDDEKDDGSPVWHRISVKSLIGPAHAAPFEQAGIATLIQAVKAIEGDQIKAMLRDEEIVKSQADMLQSYVARYLSDRSIDHNLGKPRKLDELPDVPAAKKDEKPAQPAVEAIKLVELSNPEWDEACSVKAMIEGGEIVPVTRPWKPLKMGGRDFLVLRDPIEVGTLDLHAVMLTPKSDWLGANPDRKPRQDIDPDAIHHFDGVLLSCDAGEMVGGQSVRLTLRKNKSPKQIPPAAPTPGKKAHKPVHPKGKAAKAAVRRKAEAASK